TPSFSTRPCLPSGLNGVSPRIISAGHKPASQQRRNPGMSANVLRVGVCRRTPPDPSSPR
ncbi:hypothetical protein, partial [Mycobacterium marinum]|uniref:hypothetical protein n=1 Tax=Mycobacterium marinum TaxID=1781 RepID=UPI0021C33D7B